MCGLSVLTGFLKSVNNHMVEWRSSLVAGRWLTDREPSLAVMINESFPASYTARPIRLAAG
jgi:hypothetical protein